MSDVEQVQELIKIMMTGKVSPSLAKSSSLDLNRTEVDNSIFGSNRRELDYSLLAIKVSKAIFTFSSNKKQEKIYKYFINKSVFTTLLIIIQDQKSEEHLIEAVWFLANLLGLKQIENSEFVLNELFRDLLSKDLIYSVINLCNLPQDYTQNSLILAD